MNHPTNDYPSRAIPLEASRCTGCLFHTYDEQGGRDHCFRFARFVDHVIQESTEDCEYRYPAGRS